MPSQIRRVAVAVIFCASFCLLAVRVGSQAGSPRRVTHTPPGAINLNPSLSGDGRMIFFESSADLAAGGSAAGFRLISADTSAAPAFRELALARAPAPSVSQDGSRVAFASREDPLGQNRDGNYEIFLSEGDTVRTSWQMLPRSSYNR